MKEVTYEYTIERFGAGHTIQGTITERPTGAPKVSIKWANDFHRTEVYKARALAQKIIAANYIHPAVKSVTETKAELVDIIKTHTAEMLVLYLEQTEASAKKNFAWYEKCLTRTDQEWYNAYNVEFVEKESHGKKHIVPAAKEYNGKRLYKMRNDISAVIDTVKKGLDAYIAKKKTLATLHYENSTIKLARRITDRGFNQELITVTSGRVGVNLELIITDGTKKIKCFTIVAEGEIQQAHYRYLIKDRK
jgi:hypothetical protein